VALAAFACLPVTALGWGEEGHRLIAAIAASHLAPPAAAEVKALLAQHETLESVSAWADQVRPDRPETATWHYVNIAVTDSRIAGSVGQWKQYCPPSGCVVSAISEMMARLRDRSLDRSKRAEALKFLVHFVGDMHQPLHAGDSRDRGGNDVQVTYAGRATNLHSAWDTALLRDWLARPAEKARLEKGPGYWKRRSMSRGTIDDWIWQTHAVARDIAYRRLPQARPAAIDEGYLAAAGPAIAQQIERAGSRLARLLNEALAR
jgi:hypothetical protein